MGAFNGLIPRSYLNNFNIQPAPVAPDNRTHIRSQSGFVLHKDFGLPELEALVVQAVSENKDTVWIPRERVREQGKTGVSTWYAQVVLDRLKQGLVV